jgi:hypothetical protein
MTAEIRFDSEGPGPTWLLEQLAAISACEGDLVEVRLEGTDRVMHLLIEVVQVIPLELVES